jgi:2-polyprenyl-3-methyl-5-hydroxy-6-metoxy-1,4-benzoquinol methylase
MNKKLILKISNLFSLIWLLVPSKIRKFLFTSFFILESRGSNKGNGLKRLFELKSNLEWVINERSIAYDKGTHPKHRLTPYHDFFIDRINDGEVVLDVGCGQAIVAASIAAARKNSFVFGIDIDEDNIKKGKNLINEKKLKNVKLIFGDVYEQRELKADKVIISNVLEHINNRIEFIEYLKLITKAKYFLIRVPLFERNWQIPLMRELGIDYFSDIDHKIEHTIMEFKKEMSDSKLIIKEMQTLWGEIWVSCINE